MDQQNEARPVEKVLKWRSFFIAFLSVLWLFFALYVFPSFNYPDTLDGLKLLDLRFFYTPDDVALLFAQLGEDGRHTYFKQLLIADMFYPLIYSILLYQILLILLTATARRRFFLRLSVLPLLAGLADVLENLNIIGMLTSNPKITTAQTLAGSAFGSAKWLMVLSSLLLILFYLLPLLHLQILKVRKSSRH